MRHSSVAKNSAMCARGCSAADWMSIEKTLTSPATNAASELNV